MAGPRPTGVPSGLLPRRRIIAAPLLLAPTLVVHPPRPARAAEAMPPEGTLRFSVMRNNSRIGQHIVEVRRDGAAWTARINVEIVVSIGPIAVYRYTLTARETWRDDRFATFDSDTNDDGTRLAVRAARQADGVAVEASGAARAILAADAIPLTHWNRQCMRAPLFSARNGERHRPTVQPRGEEMVALADGSRIRAERYTLSGDVALDDWYEASGAWAAMRTTGRDGSTIEYRRAP